MSDLYQRTLEKKSYLESLGYMYISKSECDFDSEILENHEIKSFVDYVTPQLCDSTRTPGKCCGRTDRGIQTVSRGKIWQGNKLLRCDIPLSVYQ